MIGMKKVSWAVLFVVGFAACDSETENIPEPEQEDSFNVLTFENSDYKGNVTGYWTSLIDNPQYNGKLLYGEYGAGATQYSWSDENNTFLKHEFEVDADNYKAYWLGGMAVSNYVDTDLSHSNYDYQLSVPIKDEKTGFGGHEGSENFCVVFCGTNSDNYDEAPLVNFYFSDETPRVIDHLYVTLTTYSFGSAKNGDGFAKPLGDTGWFKVTAIGYNEQEQTGTTDFYLVKDGKYIDEWTKWDLSSLGKVTKVKFTMDGTGKGTYGLNTAAYFAIDDIAVCKD